MYNELMYISRIGSARILIILSYYYVLVESFSAFPALKKHALGGLSAVDERWK